MSLQDDFEVVPQDDQDVEMWDVSNENEDALKQAHIQSLSRLTLLLGFRSLSARTRAYNCGSHDPSSTVGQS